MKRRLVVVSSCGGHLTQALLLIKKLEMSELEVYVITEKHPSTEDIVSNKRITKVFYVPHGGRENKVAYPFKFLANLFVSCYVLFFVNPRFYLSTGAHTAIPSMMLGWLFRKKTIFIESFAKTATPTKTGKLLYKFVDYFYIQWPELKKHYPQALYKGGIY